MHFSTHFKLRTLFSSNSTRTLTHFIFRSDHAEQLWLSSSSFLVASTAVVYLECAKGDRGSCGQKSPSGSMGKAHCLNEQTWTRQSAARQTHLCPSQPHYGLHFTKHYKLCISSIASRYTRQCPKCITHVSR